MQIAHIHRYWLISLLLGASAVVSVSEAREINSSVVNCLKAWGKLMGGLTIKAHCRAHLATTSGDLLAADNSSEGKHGLDQSGTGWV